MSFRKKTELSLSTRGQRTLLHNFHMPRRKKRAGVGTTASCLARIIHPSAPIREQYRILARYVGLICEQ